ncbi:Uncharacterised protein [Serratia quinivorans]|nr:Uncharacterised protein [Serratia quinivorans]
MGITRRGLPSGHPQMAAVNSKTYSHKRMIGQPINSSAAI